MKTLDMTPIVLTTVPAVDDRPAKTQPYPLQDVLVNILFNQPHLKARDILRRDDIARKILACEGDTLLLEDAEYEQLAQAVDTVEGFGRNDAELIRRVLAAK